ncbi:hypothetical protein GOC83_04385 [Haloarcula rubripromontorii]|uniref:Uncharacterized protein n=1 Tax=Haloarcula rubripromontorii TaxID=1705562 RepID=A0A847U3D5_9EURY|nr:hypothetical protein [Haloarcula rubripromontorii]
MPDRVPSDHDAVETHRVPVESVGRTDRPRVTLPDELDFDDGDTVRLALDGDRYHAVVETSLDGEPVISHVADNRRLARERDGTNRLAEWVADSEISLGGSAPLDVVTDGTEYGLRTPGKRVVYTATGGPDSSLSDIARNLDN